jgi:hypothetical protein
MGYYTAYGRSLLAHNNADIKYVSSTSQGKRICEVPQADMNVIEIPCDQNRAQINQPVNQTVQQPSQKILNSSK